MGKKLRQQRRGKGSPTFTAPSHRNLGKICLPIKGEGVVLDLVHCPGHSTPIAVIKSEDKIFYIPAVNGLAVGQKVAQTSTGIGSITELGNLQEGTQICCVELKPRDGGKMIRTAGSSGTVISREGKIVVIRLPSGKVKRMDAGCRAIVGIIAGGGKKEKPFIKAGKHFYAVKARNKYWPKVSANKKNPVDHPYGGGKHKNVGRPEAVGKSAPPRTKGWFIMAKEDW